MAERTVQFNLNTAGTHWVARGRDPILAPPWVDPPVGIVAVFDDPASTFNSSKGFG